MNEAPPPCPHKSLWQEPPPSLGSGIPGCIRSARPIPPRSGVIDLLPLHAISFYIGRGEPRPSVWSAPDRPAVPLKEAEPAAVDPHTQYPSLAALLLSSPQVSASADLAIWTSADQKAPSVAPCEFASSRPLSFPAGGFLRPTGVVLALSDASWQLTSSFFTPRRRIASPEPAMRPLRAPESHCRAASPMVVRPTRMAEMVDHRPWKVVDNAKPIIADCQHLTPEPWRQLANALPFKALSPQSVFQETVPTWLTVPNSYVRRVEFGFLAQSASSVRISQPLPAIAH
jgi:hypothetical protein